MIILNLNILQFITHLLKRHYHIVYFDAIHKICAVPQSSLHSIEFLVKLFDVRESSEVRALQILPHLRILHKVLNNV